MKKKDKIKLVEEIKKIAEKYRVVGVINLHKLPASSMQAIRKNLRGHAIIKVAPKAVIKKLLDSREEWKALGEKIGEYPALIFSNLDPFKLYKIIEKNKSPAPAKAGDIAPKDIEVKAGKTDLTPGPAITTLQKLKLKTKVEGGKISIVEDAVICKKGEVITPEVAAVLNLLKIMPIEIGLNVLALCENGIIYPKEVLHIDEEEVIKKVEQAYREMINFSLNVGYVIKDTAELFIIKAYREMKSLALEANIITKDTIEDLLGLGEARKKALEEQIRISSSS